MSSTSPAAAAAQTRLEEARKKVVESEKEMQALKLKIRELGTDSAGGGTPNTLELVVLKVEGLPEAAKPSFSFQLSSPIEELMITKLYDPLDDKEEEKEEEATETTTETTPTEGDEKEDDGGVSVAVFKGVETSNATLTMEVKDIDIPLGSSETMDVASFCNMSDLTKNKLVTETTLDIKPNDAADADAAVICTVTIRSTYTPSAQDHREELYELLNKASERKNKNVQELNEAAKETHRAALPTKTAVKAGFLNKSSTSSSGSAAASKKKEKSKWMVWYEKTLGPESMVRVLFPVVKNYAIFFGVVLMMHFKGQELALPPPV